MKFLILFLLGLSITAQANITFQHDGEESDVYQNTDNGKNARDRINTNVKKMVEMINEINQLKKEVDTLKARVSAIEGSKKSGTSKKAEK